MFALRSCGLGSIPTSDSCGFSPPCDIWWLNMGLRLVFRTSIWEYSEVAECLSLDPAVQVRFPPRAVGIFQTVCIQKHRAWIRTV